MQLNLPTYLPKNLTSYVNAPQGKIFDQGITAKVQDETNAIFFITFNSKRELV